MTAHLSFRSTLIAAFATVAIGVATTGPVSAQQQDSGWLWGGANETVGGSGRQVVRFSPQYPPGQIIVSFGDRKLYHIVRQGEAVSYPIAIPREQSRWQGVTSVTSKRENPSWTPTPTMIAENPRLPRWVPGGHPLNPLGVRALYLGSSAYRIHGTDAPWTIGSAVSKGCIRMYNQDVLDLYPRVANGTKVTVTWQTFGAGAPIAQSQPVPSAPMREASVRERGSEDRYYREVRRPLTRVAAADYAPSSARAKRTASVQIQEAAAEEATPKRKYSSAKKVVARKVSAKRVSSADSSED